ncbi:MAG: Ig-like domain-containing protein [Candidatus Binatia bacterium]
MRIRAALLVSVLLAGLGCHSRGDEGKRLESITLAPREVRRSVGQVQHLTATGHYEGGETRNLTQRLQYTSSDPKVATAENAKEARSRITAVGPGTAVISATDPKTGVSSHAGGGDATFVVLGALERLTLTPSAVKRLVGQVQRLTATGHYAGGATRNLTQHVTYQSSDAAVAAVPNVDGDKSRVETKGVGTATISAVDPATGITSADGGDVSVTVIEPGSAQR